MLKPENLRNFLLPFYNITLQLCAGEWTTISNVLPICYNIRSSKIKKICYKFDFKDKNNE